ncbi:polysaccharide lyase family protein [Agromyces ramosus]|uniref:polysaccharide lyase family protein n=1 Tax=Agromyces ramosus TaxID=33879 RepID=UPI0027D8D885|nr:polysaccharide lyase family protein [Agromyces ramosus]
MNSSHAMTRRTFGKILGISATALAPLVQPVSGAASAASATEPPVVTETDAEVIVDNGVIQLTVNKSNGRMTSLVYGGVNMVGRGNYDMNTVREGAGLPLPPADNGLTIRREQDFVDIAFRHSPSGDMPCWLIRHHIVRTGEAGVHLAYSYDHPAAFHGFRIDQHRYVFYTAGDTFTHASVPDDVIGTPWREAAAQMPTADELSRAPMVMDATYDLEGTGSSYPRRHYTKYDWAVYMKDHSLHGLYGNGYGMWAALPNLEAFTGGPVRQDLILHQTSDGPVLLVEPHATHYGAPPVRVEAGQAWQKTYGPYFVYVNQGDDPRAMRRDAARQARFDAHAAFYDRLGVEGWAPTAQRSRVRGKAQIPGVPNLAGAVAVLSDNRVEMQRTVLGYSYWSDIDEGGQFAIDNVRPGTYRLTIYGDGVWGEYVIDDVQVGAGQDIQLGRMLWTPESHGRSVFQVGSPNRTSVEYRNGRDFRQYGLYKTFHEDFPEGATYIVGESTEAAWNYIQYQRAYLVEAPEGTVVPENTEGIRLFDFGSAGSPVAQGYERVAQNTLYGIGGFGLDRVVASRDRGQDGDLQRDFTVGSQYTFSVELPNGDYQVTVISGDAIAANKTRISFNGGELVDLTAGTGEYAVHTADVTVDAGRLDVAASGDGRINAVEIVSADAAVPVLQSLSIDGAELVPGFSAFRSDFAADFHFDQESVTVHAVGRGGAHVAIDGVPVPATGLAVPLDGRHSVIEIQVTGDDGSAPTTYRIHATRQELPWRILFDLDGAPTPGAQATLSVGLAAWSMGSALPVPPEESNLTVTINGEAFVWTFQPDDARGATYRSGCGGRTYRNEFTFDASLLKPQGNEISLQINAGAEHLWNEAAYDSVRLEIR